MMYSLAPAWSAWVTRSNSVSVVTIKKRHSGESGVFADFGYDLQSAHLREIPVNECNVEVLIFCQNIHRLAAVGGLHDVEFQAGQESRPGWISWRVSRRSRVLSWESPLFGLVGLIPTRCLCCYLGGREPPRV